MKPVALHKRRIDQLLVERGLAESRQQAQALLLAGSVMVDGQRVDKAGQMIAAGAGIEVSAGLRYVSRGGLKLEAALEAFRIDPTGRVCADIGTSTGGFTDCLLQHGASRVHAIDVGASQIAWRLRQDARVVLHEHCNARYLKPEEIGEACSLVVVDVSFISVTLIVPVIPAILAPGAGIVILVKPQFEVGRAQVGKGGVVRDPALRESACVKVEQAVRAVGLEAVGAIPCPVLGAEGNQEFLLYGRN